MDLSQIKNKAHLDCAFNKRPFAALTLSNMVEKFHIEAISSNEQTKEINSTKLKELNPFDGSFQIEMIQDKNEVNQDDETNFIEIRSFTQRAKEEGLI